MRTLCSLLLLPGIALAVVGQVPSIPSAVGQLAQAHEQLEHARVADALVLLEKLAPVQPPIKGVQHELGLAYYRTGKLLPAKQAFAAAVMEDPTDLESKQMEGFTLYRLGQPVAAIPYLEQVRTWMPNADADANYVLGLCYLNSRRYDDARKAFAIQFEDEPNSASAYLLLGTMLMHADLPELASQQAQKALDISPNFPMAHFMVGEVALYKSNIPLAIAEFEAERRINPDYAPVYDRLGDAYLRIDKLVDAQKSLTKAISLDTTSTGPFILMGKVLLRSKDDQTAIMYLKHAEKMDPSNYITHTLLAQGYRAAGLVEDAQREIAITNQIHVDHQLKLEPIK